MSFLNPTPKICLLLLLTAALSSCVKDIDLDQANNITAQPELDVDLLYFEVDQDGFRDTLTGNLQTKISDTVHLEFLREDYIQRDLREVVFSFKCINSFPQSFNASIGFLAEDNSVQHPINFSIAPGTVADPVTTEKIEPIGADKIGKIRESIKMVVEIEAVGPYVQPFKGELKFQSKGLFSFNFNL